METPTDQHIRNSVSTPAPDEIRISRVFDAPRQLVWNAWTSPAMLVHWFGCAAFSTISAEVDLRIGGHWHVVLRTPDGEDIPSYGTYTAIEPIDHLAFTHQWEKAPVDVNPPHHRTLVTIHLHEVGSRTQLKFRQTGLDSEASRESHIGGWCDSMDTLAEALRATESAH
jgi:uncharacterized protein YndB with AHSA1/START domain